MPSTTERARRLQGMAIVEVLIAVALLAGGTLALVRLQSALRSMGDDTRQSDFALRQTQSSIERLRELDSIEAFEAQAASSPTLSLTPNIYPRVESVLARAEWTERSGQTRPIELATMLAGNDPALSGVLLLSRRPWQSDAPAQSGRRRTVVPASARDIGDGRSVFKPIADAAVAWIIDNRTGLVIASCALPSKAADGTAPSDLDRCTPSPSWLISGYVRFATDTDRPTAVDARMPDSRAMPLHLCATRGDTAECAAPKAGDCVDDAPVAANAGSWAGQANARFVTFVCAVPADGTDGWTGRINVVPVGWRIGAEPESFRICRYSFDRNGNGRVDSEEHPSIWHGLKRTLLNQNFLVVRGEAPCPVDTPAPRTPLVDNAANVTTVQHQP